MNTSRGTMAIAALTLCLAFIAPCAAAPDADAQALRQKQEAQQKARALARELVTSILDIQLQQLKENGLEELPLYGEIQSMKKNIHRLVDDEMQKVVELLIKAQQGPKADREQSFKDARSMIREVVLKLSIERQNLLRRLKTAEIVAQVKRLILMESNCLGITRKLPEQPPTQREKVALNTIEDQRDVRQLFLQLEDILKDVSRWGGAVGNGATEGLAKLADAGVRKELDTAGKNLEGAQFPDAAKNQEAVIAGLRKLLERIEQVQGLLNAERQQSLDSVKDMVRRQEQIREETKKADLANDAARDKLVKDQANLRKDFEKLNPAATTPAAKALLEQAKEAAYETTEKLFESKQEEALAEQGKVIGNLAELETQLQEESVAEDDKSADEYAKTVSDLEAARKDVMALQERQAQAEKAAPEAAAPQERQIAADTAKVDDNRDLPKPVQSALAKAESELNKSADALQKPAADEAAKKEQAAAVEQGTEALDRARAEIETALADTKRKQLAVEIGELARASESLERAAAAEREIAKAAEEAAKTDGLSADEARELRQEQTDIDAVARKVAEGTKQTAPEISKMLDAAAEQTRAAEQQLQAAEQQPGEASKPAAKQTAEKAKDAAGKLEQAAADLRKQFGKVAEELAKEAGDQQKPVAETRDNVESALKKDDDSVAKRMADLAAAREQVRQAEQSQQKAAGRPEAAEAMDRADEIGEAAAAQAQADAAAEDLAKGETESPLDAAKAEQAVADKARDIAQDAKDRPQAKQAQADGKPDPLAESLKQAQEAAAEASKALVDGDMPEAAAARAKAREALKQAQATAKSEADAAKQAPAGKPDPAAQQDVAEKAAAAEKLAQTDAPAAAAALDEAEASAGEAGKNIEAGRPADAPQKAVGEKLAQADKQLQEAMKQLGEQSKQQLAGKSEQAAQLAKQAEKVDAAANAALQQAEHAAEQAAAESAGDEPADPAQPADAPVQQAMERAAANLNAREQRLERDKQIAEAIAKLAQQQQKAADQIAENRQKLEDLPIDLTNEPAKPAEGDPKVPNPAGTPQSGKPGDPTPKPGDSQPKPTAEQKAAAEKLGEAQQQFAQAQRATGQGAEQVSGQEQVANEPIREALEIASNLGKPPVPPTPAVGQPMGQTPKPGEAAKPAEGTPAQPGEPAAGTPKPGEPGTPAPGEPAPGEPSQPGEGLPQGEPTGPELGTAFVPNSPETTAKMMAGPDAQALLAALVPASLLPPGQKALAQGEAKQPGDKPAQPAPDGQPAAQPKDAKPGKTSPKATANSSSKNGEVAKNDKVKPGPLESVPDAKKPNADSRTDAEKKDSDAQALKYENETWFAKLPPELRQAMRARAQRRAPKAYEERLRRYFESLD